MTIALTLKPWMFWVAAVLLFATVPLNLWRTILEVKLARLRANAEDSKD